MAYKALYRKYRPNTFDEVVGQQYIIETLKNAIKNNKLAHAYLFCGPRGTGKTTIAKILAKTINCESDGNRPCCQCANCIDIQQGSHPDVIEMDAASNNGVDEVREIVDKVKYAPMHGKYKVYIIDEVHMMTTSAFNALLKTLEEPPEYCIFILATTEPHKVLPTIVSRCQRFDFKKIAKPVIVGNLDRICDAEGVHCDKDALNLIADLAEGGMRDALSILDQCIAYSQNNIRLQDVSDVYGIATLDDKIKLFQCVKDKNSKQIVNEINNLSIKGIDISRLTTDLINIAKEAVVYGFCSDSSVLSVIDEVRVKKLLEMFNSNQLLTFIDYLIDTQGKYRDATNSLTYFEICLLKMMDYQPTTKQVVNNIEQEPVNVSRETIVKTESKKTSIQQEQLPQINHYLSYDDEELYNILIKANKPLKETDIKIIGNLPLQLFNEKEKKLLNIITKADIMASSADSIIFAVNERETANEINEENNNALLTKLLASYLPSQKKIISITLEQRDYMINYFKSRQQQLKAQQQVDVQEKKQEEINKAEEKLNSLFGKDGYDIEGE